MTNDMPASEAKSGLSAGKIAIVLAIGVAVAAFFYFDLGRFLSLQVLKDNRDYLLSFTETHSAAAAALFVLAYVAVTGLSLPGAVILTLAGGFLFGAVLGTLFVNLGATTGATLAFLVSRYLLRDWVEQKFGKWLGPVQQGFAQNAFGYLMTLRLIPLFPFFVVNLVSGLTRMNVGTYVVATALGIIPGSFVYAYAGPATRYDQFFERHCFSRSDWSICIAGASGACAKPVQEVVWETSMIANPVKREV